jgi:hypothetical protein
LEFGANPPSFSSSSSKSRTKTDYENEDDDEDEIRPADFWHFQLRNSLLANRAGFADLWAH